MKTVKQLLRQPMKTLFGVILIALAVAVLCVCLGQAAAAEETQKRLNDIFATIALPTVDYTKEADLWALDYAGAHPEVVKAAGTHSLIGTYIPELNPKNYTEHVAGKAVSYINNNYLLLPGMSEIEYPSAMLEITLTEVGTPSTQWLYSENGSFEYMDVPSAGAYVTICGVVENVLGLADGYPDYRGYTVSSYIYMPSMEDLENLGLAVGDRYLIYSTDLRDSDRSLRSAMIIWYPELWEVMQRPFDLEMVTVSEAELNRDGFNGQDYVATYEHDGHHYAISRQMFEQFRKLIIDIIDESAMPNFTWELDSAGNPAAVLLDHQTYLGKNGESITVTPEEYHERYAEPTIVHLEGTAEEFLASEEGALWREALYNIEINSHAFPVIGVEDMNQIADFAQSKAAIVAGRDFTAQELSGGAKVCIMSQSLAEQNGLAVGDSLRVQHFENDPGVPYQINISEGNGSAKPVAYFFFDRTMDLQEAEEYTIIGLYDQEIEWEYVGDNLYCFSPNTIFVPESAVSARMDYGYAAFFRSFMLHNGTIDEFQLAASEAGYAGMFYFNDNGYSAVGENLDFYKDSVGRALIVGICVYAVVILLFFLFFPMQQKPTLRIMETLGSKCSTQRKHMMFYCSAILIPGTMMGILAGALSWKYVVNSLLQSSDTVIEVTVRFSTMLAVGVIQLILTLFLSLLAALFITNGKNVMKRR